MRNGKPLDGKQIRQILRTELGTKSSAFDIQAIRRLFATYIIKKKKSNPRNFKSFAHKMGTSVEMQFPIMFKFQMMKMRIKSILAEKEKELRDKKQAAQTTDEYREKKRLREHSEEYKAKSKASCDVVVVAYDLFLYKFKGKFEIFGKSIHDQVDEKFTKIGT
jgi:cyanate lyase